MKPKLRHYINFPWNNITKMSQISWGLSQQNRRTLVIGGQEFTKKQETKNGNIHWKCSRWGSHKCKTTAVNRENDLISSRNEHTHEVFPGRSDARLFVQKMKQDKKVQQVQVNSIIIANGLQSVSEEKTVQLALPCRSAINRALNRQKVNDRPTFMHCCPTKQNTLTKSYWRGYQPSPKTPSLTAFSSILNVQHWTLSLVIMPERRYGLKMDLNNKLPAFFQILDIANENGEPSSKSVLNWKLSQEKSRQNDIPTTQVLNKNRSGRDPNPRP